MFAKFEEDTALAVVKALYCEGVFINCARYKSITGGVIPPRDLLPDGRKLAPKTPKASGHS